MKPLTATKLFTLAFGLFLGLCLWKFGNPVILDHKIPAPNSLPELLNAPWPTHWARWLLLPLAAWGGMLALPEKFSWPQRRWLWLLPLGWLGWQFISATQSVDAPLTEATLWQFSGCVACYFLGAFIFSRENLWRWLLPGVLAAFTFCLIRGAEQRLYEFPTNYLVLTEGERGGWTNFPPETIVSLKADTIIITTNGVDVANPVFLKKFQQGRVAGTMVYPNALAGIILLLWPVALVLAFTAPLSMKPPIRLAVIALTIFLGGAVLFWTGSKLGWLIAIALAGLCLLRLNWSKQLKIAAITLVVLGGLGGFAMRFHNYFATGATSVGARFDYWRAAAQTTVAKPIFGSGPGTFQRPYAQLKAPESEMARLTHNDYFEQFSDSGMIGGLTFAAWIGLALLVAGKKLWQSKELVVFAIFIGLLGWFLQGLGEFGLYIPTSWLAFTLLGCLIGEKRIEFDKKSVTR
jgi:O-antigen ligase